MALVTCGEMKALEQVAFDDGVVAEDLMDLAGMRVGDFVHKFFRKSGMAVAYLGKGNNGGDALVALQTLRAQGWEVMVRAAHEPSELGPLPQKKLDELGVSIVQEMPLALRDFLRPLVLLDGLVGIGAQGALRDPLAGLAREMNELRKTAGARTVAIDLPSGMNGDTGEVYEDAVVADVTCTLGVAKRGLVADEAVDTVGRLELLPLEQLPEPNADEEKLVTADFLRAHLLPREFSWHKGMAGRVAVMAGSPDYVGAAVLTAMGALRGGAGLVSLLVEKSLSALARASGLPPEVMVPALSTTDDALLEKFDALVVGPGLGSMNEEDGDKLLGFLRSWKRPMVVDADALNLIAREQAWDVLGEHCLLTPHPGEMTRLRPDESDHSRAERARDLADITGAVVLFKGARTVITGPSSSIFFNTTGTPAMATGGQGDLLSGVLGALLAQGQSPIHAACAGSWLCGRAAEIALEGDVHSEESLLPTDVSGALGKAFRDLRGQI